MSKPKNSGTGIGHVMQLIQWLPHPSPPSLHTRQLRLTEQMLSGILAIDPGIFADSILQMLPAAVNAGALIGKAITSFIRILMTPPFDTKRHDAAMENSTSPHPVPAGISAICWRQQAANSVVFNLAAQPKFAANSQPLFEGTRS